MADLGMTRDFQESRIEVEPVLGHVLVLPGGRIQPLTRLERMLAALRLVTAKRLETRYLKAAQA